MEMTSEITVSNRRGNIFNEIWQYRHAIRNFVERDLTVRYKRSILGFLWSFFNPLLMILTYVIVFKHLWRINDPNYSVTLFCTILPWRFFNQAVMDGSGSVGQKLMLIKRVHFPRIILPASSLVANFIDFMLSLTILVVYFIYVGVTPHWPALPLIALALIIQLILIFGLSMIVSSISVFFKDVQFLINSLFQMWFFLSPILYPARKVVDAESVHEIYKTLYFLNPMAPLLMAYRSIVPGEPTNSPFAILPGNNAIPGYYTFLAISAAIAVTMFIIGSTVFRRLEPTFAKEG